MCNDVLEFIFNIILEIAAAIKQLNQQLNHTAIIFNQEDEDMVKLLTVEGSNAFNC